MRHKLVAVAVVTAALVLSMLSIRGIGGPTVEAADKAKPAPSPTTGISTPWDLNSYGPPTDRLADDIVLQWNELLLQTIRDNPAGTGPTVAARALGVVQTSIYDAWAAYDPVAKRTRSTGVPRQPSSEATVANKSKAISFAAYTTLVDLFPDRTALYAGRMAALHYDLTDASTPAMIGKRAAEENIAFRHGDYSNQTLAANGTTTYPYVCPPAPGATCYSQVNTQWNNLVDKWHWQPLCVLTAAGVAAGLTSPTPPDGNCVGPNYTVQQPLTPQWQYMKPFALTSAVTAKVPGPPTNADGTYSDADIRQEYADTLNLTDLAKTKAEYWADGPKSVFPPGHDMIFAQALSRKRGFSLDTNVKLFFALGNAMLDSSIAAWAQKYIYDFVRPITAIRWYHAGQNVTSWLPGRPPGQDYGQVPAEQWLPYQALNVVTPPFPEYVSGHSTFSGAGQQVLMAFTGSDAFNAFVTIPAGSSKIQPGVPVSPVTLTWPTFTAAADEAGMSRRYGGIHFYSGDYHGRMLGKSVGSNTWSKAQAYFQGYAGYSS
jgi:hypothetical protein